ncbi:conserved hypothetical protein [Thermobaculum terrenum ATCC BAA-798]|uniref:Aldose 1-epimerase n=1 Tax=Thermobaculum terrenum (strain ATCC BAA-798 / CCMEE 7001 / YNP1) TaxID=525904 RepID=D1CI37_THET1|nr:hypothetical protein [Thermobaculum terrenum]ACZ43408.1 conserved hypothetical protein [Thermobaculum terrenum ATCC BAA-798]
MGVSVSTDWKLRDLRAVVLENELLRVVLLPELGGKIWQIEYRPRSRYLLWHHPRLKPREVPLHSVYDDVFFGGWDELYPNDLPEELNGERMPDHGEVWALPWECGVEAASGDAATVRLQVETPISATRLERWITLRAGEPTLRCRYRLTNLGREPQPFLWKVHVAVGVDEHCRIDLPATEMYLEEFGRSRGGRTGLAYRWPYLEGERGELHDMRRALPPVSGVCEFQYATRLEAGWCAVTHAREGLSFALAFDPEVLSSCWLFASYGGWRGLQVLVLEPCTGYPISVNEGLRRGTHRVLHPGAQVECELLAVVHEGGKGVAHVGLDGHVEPER